jgi:multidrug efflux pump subunit AcrA (membrane-fusion protein)
MYSQVKFTLPRTRATIVVPGNTVVANSSGTRVVIVGGDQRVHYVPVQLGRDLGSQIEILTGLIGGEHLVTNPPDILAEGQQVRLQSGTSKEKKD